MEIKLGDPANLHTGYHGALLEPAHQPSVRREARRFHKEIVALMRDPAALLAVKRSALREYDIMNADYMRKNKVPRRILV